MDREPKEMVAAAYSGMPVSDNMRAAVEQAEDIIGEPQPPGHDRNEDIRNIHDRPIDREIDEEELKRDGVRRESYETLGTFFDMMHELCERTKHIWSPIYDLWEGRDKEGLYCHHYKVEYDKSDKKYTGHYFNEKKAVHYFKLGEDVYVHRMNRRHYEKIRNSWQYVLGYESLNDWIPDDSGFPVELRLTNAFPDIYIFTRRSRDHLRISSTNEENARRLLLRFIGHKRFARYMRDGFVSYRGKSRLTYQIFPGHGITKVWKDGEIVETQCVIFKEIGLPPTDSVIMRLLMLEFSEDQAREEAVVHKRGRRRTAQVA